MPIKIPKAHEEPLRELARMDPARRQRLVQAIRSAKAVLDPKDLISLVEHAMDLDGKAVSAIVWMLISMYRAADGAPGGFAKNVGDTARGLFKGPEAETVDWAKLSDDISTVLACHESLGVTAKVLDVRREYANVFCSARILTDVRPVFGPDPTQTPLAAAIVHTVRIAHHTGDSHEDFYVALDSADLRSLRDQIERALKKEASLKGVLGATSLKYLDPEHA
jgi:hypothetical protein